MNKGQTRSRRQAVGARWRLTALKAKGAWGALWGCVLLWPAGVGAKDEFSLPDSMIHVGARSRALGGLSLAFIGEGENVFNNPATIAAVSQPQGSYPPVTAAVEWRARYRFDAARQRYAPPDMPQLPAYLGASWPLGQDWVLGVAFVRQFDQDRELETFQGPVRVRYRREDEWRRLPLALCWSPNHAWISPYRVVQMGLGGSLDLGLRQLSHRLEVGESDDEHQRTTFGLGVTLGVFLHLFNEERQSLRTAILWRSNISAAINEELRAAAGGAAYVVPDARDEAHPRTTAFGLTWGYKLGGATDARRDLLLGAQLTANDRSNIVGETGTDFDATVWSFGVEYLHEVASAIALIPRGGAKILAQDVFLSNATTAYGTVGLGLSLWQLRLDAALELGNPHQGAGVFSASLGLSF